MTDGRRLCVRRLGGHADAPSPSPHRRPAPKPRRQLTPLSCSRSSPFRTSRRPMRRAFRLSRTSTWRSAAGNDHRRCREPQAWVFIGSGQPRCGFRNDPEGVAPAHKALCCAPPRRRSCSIGQPCAGVDANAPLRGIMRRPQRPRCRRRFRDHHIALWASRTRQGTHQRPRSLYGERFSRSLGGPVGSPAGANEPMSAARGRSDQAPATRSTTKQGVKRP